MHEEVQGGGAWVLQSCVGLWAAAQLIGHLWSWGVGVLQMDAWANVSRPTPLNVVSHPYWNLDNSDGNTSIAEHELAGKFHGLCRSPIPIPFPCYLPLVITCRTPSTASCFAGLVGPGPGPGAGWLAATWTD